MATKAETDKLNDKLAVSKQEATHWRTRALIAEKEIQQANQKFAVLNKSYHDLSAELEETRRRLPTGTALTYINNLVRINDAYRRELVGDKVNFWQRFRFLLPLLLKGQSQKP